jgi:hypothetical protein
MYIKRYILRPTDQNNSAKFEALTGKTSIIPVDEFLHIDKLPFKVTARMMLEAAYWAQNQGSYEAAQIVLKRHNIFLNDDTIRSIVNHIGSIVHNNDIQYAEKIYKTSELPNHCFDKNIDGVVYIETDGAAINTRTKNNDDSTWRENKLGIVFNTNNIKQRRNYKTKELYHIIEKREYISFIGSAEKFTPLLFSIASKNGYGSFKNCVVLSDGATWIRNMVQTAFPDAQQILDYFHLCENIYTFSKIYFKNDDVKAKNWAETICKDLKDSKTEHVLKILKPLCNKTNIKPNVYQYIINNLNNVDYKSYLAKGYFIGSGAIESGNRTVLQSRLKRPGQRWNIETAQNMLTLRAKQESGLWFEEVEKPILKIYE